MTNKTLVTVCSYCPTKDEETAQAEKDGFSVTHWICKECYKEQMDILDKIDIIMNTGS